LLSQGHCAVLGCLPPTPYFLQELVLSGHSQGAFDDLRCTNILCSATVSAKDEAFHNDIIQGRAAWWKTDTGDFPSFDFLTELVDNRYTQVISSIQHLYKFMKMIIIFS
jgi:hypothetical protein